MGDPTRLLSGDGDAQERALLESLRMSPPAQARDGMWRAMAAQLGTAAVITGGSAAVASSAASAASSVASATKLTSGALLSKALVAKVALVVAVSAAGAGGTVLWRARTQPAAHVQPAVSVQPAASVQPAVQAAKPAPVERVAPAAPDALCTEDCAGPAPRRVRTQPLKLDALREESRLLAEARASLRAGELDTASETLKSARARFAHGTLAQEREVLQIELLAAQGKAPSAARRAQRFLRQHPESPHAESVQRFVNAP